VLLAIGQLRANVMAVNEVNGDEKRPVEQSGSPFANGGAPSSSLGHGAKVEPQESRSVPRAQKLDSEESVCRTGEHGALQGDEQVRMGAQPTSRVDPSDSAEGLSSTFEQVQLGQGLYPTASLLNHSCDPSTGVSFVGNKLVVRAVQGVKAGAELSLSYGPQKGEQRTTKRRKWLWERYAFVCNCAACTGVSTPSHRMHDSSFSPFCVAKPTGVSQCISFCIPHSPSSWPAPIWALQLVSAFLLVPETEGA
jgi:hypothetical protein